MRGKDFNTGLRGVLFEARHYQRMGAAVWLYGWLVLRQTHQSGSLGWVLGGSTVSYREIEEETGFNCRTLERWMHELRRAGYIETDTVPGGLVIRITKAKKFPQGVRKCADGARKFADRASQSCVPSRGHLPDNSEIAERISSSSVHGFQENTDSVDFHRDFHGYPRAHQVSRRDSNQNPTRVGQNSNPPTGEPVHSARPVGDQGSYASDARLLRQLLRAERDEAVRRELAVGTGPEVPRS